MLVMDSETGELCDTHFARFPSLLHPGDLLVLNDSRVIPARLYARRTLLRDHEKPTGRIEVMLTEPAGENARLTQANRFRIIRSVVGMPEVQWRPCPPPVLSI